MNWTYDAALLRRCLLLVLTVALVGGCGRPDSRPETDAFPIRWAAIDSLNATLPPDIRVYAGRNDSLPLRAWAVHVRDPHEHPVDVVRSDEPDGAEPVSRFAQQSGVCVAVNGGYYDPNTDPIQPAGLLLNDSLQRPPTDTLRRDSMSYPVARGALGLLAEGDPDVAWTTLRHDTLLKWAKPPRNSPSGAASMPPRSAAEPWQVSDAVGAGPVLVAAGTTAVTSDAEVFFGTGIPGVHPRTAAGVTADGALLVLVVDGRQPESRGASLHELARLMRDRGAVEAVNLDGGGSSTLVVRGHLLNRPAGGTDERDVATAVVARCRADAASPRRPR